MQEVYNLTREDMVIRTFFSDKILSQKMMPYLDPTLYEDKTNQQVVSIVNKFIRKHHRSPEAQACAICWFYLLGASYWNNIDLCDYLS